MTIKRRIFISSPRDEHLDDLRNELKWAIVDEIEKLGYEAQVFGSADGGKGLAAGKSWIPDEANKVMRRCVGAAILGFPIWKGIEIMNKENEVPLVSEYCHYEGALARAYRLPILSVLEQGLKERVFFVRYGGDIPVRPPAQIGKEWVSGDEFQNYLEKWDERIRKRKDVFLAYSSGSVETAQYIKGVLTKLGVSTLDWKSDFVGGPTILDQINEAVNQTSGGVFLFTRDDMLMGAEELAAPRDNVVFEAGIFANSKGYERVLIVLEEGAKLPADLGGIVYVPMADKRNLVSIEPQMKRFIDNVL